MTCSGIVSNIKMECSDKLNVLNESNGSVPTDNEAETSFRPNLIPRRTRTKRSTKRTLDSSDRKGKGVKIETSRTAKSRKSGDKRLDPSVANGSKHHYCSLCEIHFRYSVEYEKHCKQRHGIEKPYACVQCEKTYATKRSFVQHLRRAMAHGEVYPKRDRMRAIFCDICEITSHGWSAFEKHALTVHEGIRMMRCSQCPKAFILRKYLTEHKRLHHPLSEVAARTFLCEFCNSMLDRTDELEQHRTYCQERRRTIHRKESVASNSVQKNAKHVTLRCDECPEVLQSFYLLKNHYEIVHTGVKLHPCDYCEEAFGQRKFLEWHLDTRHPNKDGDVASACRRRRRFRGKIYECPHCEQGFKTLVKYEKHGKEHPGKGMFRCEKCVKGFKYSRSLRNHAVADHGNGELKMRCEYCTKYFFHGDRFVKHVAYCAAKTEKMAKLRKSGVRGQRCEICDKILYVSNSYFRRHIYQHRRYDFCHLCDLSFDRIKSPTALTDHIVSQHPPPLRNEDEKQEKVKEEKYVKEEWENEDLVVKREINEED